MLKGFKTILTKQGHSQIRQKIWELKYGNAPKIFGIGNNKTGTTSLEKAMIKLGYKVGNQRTAELLHGAWAQRNFTPIISYCKTAKFFQDVPFSKPFTFVALDQAFPNSKFILTIRDNPEQWYKSLTQFHAKLWGKDGRIPTKEDLQNAEYVYKGWAWDMTRYAEITPENDPYQKAPLIQSYIDYNNSVLSYFKHRPKDLLILNVAEKGAYRKLCEFIGQPVTSEEFPWENKT
jgi:hypothetical protein